MRLIPLLLAGCAAISFASPALAQDGGPGVRPDAPTDAGLDGDRVTIGIGGAYLPDYIGSNDYRFVPAPVAVGSVKGFNFTLIGNRASLDLVREAKGNSIDFQLGPVASLNFNRNSLGSISDPRIKALGKIGLGIELGGFVGIGKTGVITSPYDKLTLTVSYRHDVNSIYNSYMVTPTLNYLTPLSRKAAIGLFASADYAGSGYANRYFGITRAQSLASGLPAYTAGKGWEDYTVGALGSVAITGDLLHGFSLVAGGTYSRMLNDYATSPVTSIAGSRDQWIGAVGLAYTF